MRRAVLEIYQIEDEASLKNVIPMLGDESEEIAGLAREKIRTADYQNSLRLVKSLSLPQKKLREALFGLLSDMAIKDLDVFRFVQLQARTCYQLTIQARGIRSFPVELFRTCWQATWTSGSGLPCRRRCGYWRLRINRDGCT
jgi:hypothetical protein